MQLTYRGSQYESSTSSVPAIPGEVIGKYRGAVLRASHYTATVPPAQSLNLLYRGAHYRAVVNSVELIGLANAI
jgi:hypothetical protein